MRKMKLLKVVSICCGLIFLLAETQEVQAVKIEKLIDRQSLSLGTSIVAKARLDGIRQSLAKYLQMFGLLDINDQEWKQEWKLEVSKSEIVLRRVNGELIIPFTVPPDQNQVIPEKIIYDPTQEWVAQKYWLAENKVAIIQESPTALKKILDDVPNQECLDLLTKNIFSVAGGRCLGNIFHFLADHPRSFASTVLLLKKLEKKGICLEQGAVDMVNKSATQMTATMLALKNGNIDFIKALVWLHEKGIITSIGTPHFSELGEESGPLYYVINKGHYDLACYMLDHGFDPNDGLDNLQSNEQNPEEISLTDFPRLLKHYSRIPIVMAASLGQPELVQRLVSNSQTKRNFCWGSIPLEILMAVLNDDLITLQILLASGSYQIEILATELVAGRGNASERVKRLLSDTYERQHPPIKEIHEETVADDLKNNETNENNDQNDILLPPKKKKQHRVPVDPQLIQTLRPITVQISGEDQPRLPFAVQYQNNLINVQLNPNQHYHLYDLHTDGAVRPRVYARNVYQGLLTTLREHRYTGEVRIVVGRGVHSRCGYSEVLRSLLNLLASNGIDYHFDTLRTGQPNEGLVIINCVNGIPQQCH